MIETTVEATLAKLGALRRVIRSRERERDAAVKEYELAIRNVRNEFDKSCEPLRSEEAKLERQLEEYFLANPPEEGRTLKFENGRLSFRKQQPCYYCGNETASANSKQLIDFVKANASEYLKVSEYIDWSTFKTKLMIDGERVYFAETGELIEGLRAQILPDTFTVKTM